MWRYPEYGGQRCAVICFTFPEDSSGCWVRSRLGEGIPRELLAVVCLWEGELGVGVEVKLAFLCIAFHTVKKISKCVILLKK